MGKYIRKAKMVGPDLAAAAAMESPLGVRTRAKTLAAAAAAAATASGGRSQPPSPPPPSANYLQLRSRQLLKPPVVVSKRQRQTQKEACQTSRPSPSPASRANSRLRPGSTESIGSFVNNNVDAGEGAQQEEPAEELSCREDSVADNENKDCSKCEVSFGENVLEFEGRDRGMRESTPCSLLRDPDVIGTPGSSTRPSAGANRRASDIEHRRIPTSQEMDEFFAIAEEEQQRTFIKRYNFDLVNDKPLPGRYEWQKLEP